MSGGQTVAPAIRISGRPSAEEIAALVLALRARSGRAAEAESPAPPRGWGAPVRAIRAPAGPVGWWQSGLPR
ncbi:MAG: acyl-CoA carboxylase subunit epsilon [Candidatus Nanopelagicales bacterium]